NCASCHHPLKDATGPALKGADGRAPSKEWLHKWVRNSSALIASGDKYANELFNKWGKIPMTPFPGLSDEEIDAIFTYVNSVEPAGPATAGGAVGDTAKGTDDSAWLYSIITVILLVLVIILWRVNSGLRRVANEREGLPNEKEIPL